MEESESKAKELMPMMYNTVMKELLEVRSGNWNQVQGSTIKQTQMGMGAKDQEEEKLKQKEQIRCSGGLDPGEAIKDKEEQFALKAQVERFVAKDKEVRCAKDWEEVNVAKDWEEERLDIKDWEEEWLAIKDVKEVKQKPREVRMLLDALMFELVLVWPMVILLKSEMQRLRFEDGTNDY